MGKNQEILKIFLGVKIGGDGKRER